MKTILAVCFEAKAPRASVGRVLERLGFSGPDPRWRLHAPGLLTVRLEKAPGRELLEKIERLPGVQRIVGREEARRSTKERTTVPLDGSALVGGRHFTVIAGPCSVESEAQVCEIAEMVKEAGAGALRGGAFKPRTSPYSFGGLGEEALGYLARARERTGLPVVTEALEVESVDVVARHADVVQIGSRNMQNFPLLFRAGSHPLGRPVLLKRGLAATIEECRLAAEYVLLGQLYAGHEGSRLILCERGIRTFETEVRYTLDVASIPILREATGLPIIADPSHAAGARKYVRPLARAAVAAGADGLLVEVHTDPRRAWSDAEQTIGEAEFRALMREVSEIAALR